MTILRNSSYDHFRSMGDAMWQFYKAGHLVDIAVHCHGKTIRAHQLVLAVFSPVLRPSLQAVPTYNMSSMHIMNGANEFDGIASMSSSSSSLRSINLDEVIDNQLDLEILLEFIYKGQVTLSESITEAGLPSLLKTAQILKIDCLVEAIDNLKLQMQRKPEQQIDNRPTEPYITLTVDEEQHAPTTSALPPCSSTQPNVVESTSTTLATVATGDVDDNLTSAIKDIRRPTRNNGVSRRTYNEVDDDYDDDDDDGGDGNAGGDDDDDYPDNDNDDDSPSFWCPHCCKLFNQMSVYLDHMSKLHPDDLKNNDPNAVSETSRLRNNKRLRSEGQKTPRNGRKSRAKSQANKSVSNDNPESKDGEGDDQDIEPVRNECPMCDFWTAHSWRLTKHLAAIHKVYEKNRKLATEKCSQCDYTCLTGAQLRRHVKCKHSTDRPHKCTEPGCDFSAAIRSELERHKTAKHCRERRFCCSYCGYRSKTKNAHDRHERTHARTTMTCKMCGLRYSSDGYRRHIKRHVVTNDDGGNSSVVTKCHLCDMLMPIIELIEPCMRVHLLDVHALDVDKKNAQIEHCNKVKMNNRILTMMDKNNSVNLITN